MMKPIQAHSLCGRQRVWATTDGIGHGHSYTLPDLERAYALVAYIVVQHGAVYLPILDRMEREVAHAKQQCGGVARAQAVLAEYAQSIRGEALQP